jgi:peptide/nickel transport system substrate-binding protein
MNRLPLKLRALLALSLIAAVHASGQRAPQHATVVYAVGKEPTMPIPLLTNSDQANEDVADQLFLHLVTYRPGGQISGDNAMLPSLAKSWHRVDSLTLIFDLDPRARWQDGAPVTAHDVIFTWQLAQNPLIGKDQARLAPIAAVEAVGDRSVRVRFTSPSAEQVYTFGFLIQPLPSHLLERLAPEAIATSEYARHPIGDGPFRFERRVAGQSLELRADSTFFLGRPTIARLLFRYVQDPNTRLTYFLTGETDIYDNITPATLDQVRAHADSRLVSVPSNAIVSLLFNSRARDDANAPNPFFSDPRVREALTLALDRPRIAAVAYGPGTMVPDAAQSQIWSWITPKGISAAPQSLIRARTLLAQAGWHDANGDGILDKGGKPLHFAISYPASSGFRNTIALLVQPMWRAAGVQLDIDKVDNTSYRPLVEGGRFDVVVGSAGEDPTPSSLTQSWSCTAARTPGSTNYGRWCDSTFDRLLHSATLAKDQPAAWRAVLQRMTSQHPAVFLAAPGNQVAVHKRFDNVIIWPSRPWLSLWQWRVRPDAALPRDR